MKQRKILWVVLAIAFILQRPAFAETPEGVVRVFYRQIVARHPLGIPAGKDKAALWPLMTSRLRQTLDVVHECERDYFRKNTCNDCKPDFWWLEDGIFSGSNEEASPAEVRVVATKAASRETYRVTVRFTYRETLATYGAPPNPGNHWDWLGIVVVNCTNKRCLIDDFVRLDRDTSKPQFVLSAGFDECDGSRWIGRSHH